MLYEDFINWLAKTGTQMICTEAGNSNVDWFIFSDDTKRWRKEVNFKHQLLPKLMYDFLRLHNAQEETRLDNRIEQILAVVEEKSPEDARSLESTGCLSDPKNNHLSGLQGEFMRAKKDRAKFTPTEYSDSMRNNFYSLLAGSHRVCKLENKSIIEFDRKTGEYNVVCSGNIMLPFKNCVVEYDRFTGQKVAKHEYGNNIFVYDDPFNCEYDEEATAPHTMAWLEERFGDQLDMWLDYSAYVAFMPNTSRVFGVLAGGSTTGKNVICEHLGKVIGTDKVLFTQFSDVFGGETSTHKLVGKTLAILGEWVPSDGHANVLKNYCDGSEFFTTRGLYRTAETVEKTCKLLMTTNEIPTFKDSSGATHRRCLVFDIDKKLPGTHPVTGANTGPISSSKFISLIQHEFPGYINILLQRVPKIASQYGFRIPQEYTDKIVNKSNSASPIALFLLDNIVEDPLAETSTTELCNAFKEFRKANCFSFDASSLQITNEMKRVFIDEIDKGTFTYMDKPKTFNGARSRYWKGLRISKGPRVESLLSDDTRRSTTGDKKWI